LIETGSFAAVPMTQPIRQELKKMRGQSKHGFLLILGILASTYVYGQCPARPASGTVVSDPPSVSSVNGVLTAQFTMAQSVDSYGYTHYCYNYVTGTQTVEAPTLQLNPSDQLALTIVNQNTPPAKGMIMMNMAPTGTIPCGDSGAATVASTNVHFHGMNVPPKCHADDVINTLIQPGSPGFQYNMQIPATEPPGLYWYHPHIHGFTEFQVNGGAAGGLIVGGIEKYRPEVTGLTQRVFMIRQQFLVPWVPGPYELTLNYQVAPIFGLGPIVQMKPGEQQFWRVANATLQDFLQLQFLVNGTAQPLEMIALDGYPLTATRTQTTISIPPAGRAEFIVTAPTSGSATFVTNAVNTGPTGNADAAQTLATIQLTSNATGEKMPPAGEPGDFSKLKFANVSTKAATTQRQLYFSEEFGGTNGPIQFYITVNGQQQKVFEANEPPAITTKVGAVEEWTIENRALETHAFHIHQMHFKLLEVDGKPAPNQDMLDTVEIPYWGGNGQPFHSVKIRLDFSDPNTAGTFVFHCHILLHEDLGMMHKILVEP
jgi:FtsP/CotA-like multicopper oxidase with cupredoxin domain